MDSNLPNVIKDMKPWNQEAQLTSRTTNTQKTIIKKTTKLLKINIKKKALKAPRKKMEKEHTSYIDNANPEMS